MEVEQEGDFENNISHRFSQKHTDKAKFALRQTVCEDLFSIKGKRRNLITNN